MVNRLTGGVDEFFSRTDSAGTTFPLTDALGSTIALTDTSGTVQTQYTYDPYGGTTAMGAMSSNTYEYTGRENDGTGLYYYRARYYSPRYQRFISEDPIGLAGGVNLYQHAASSPVIYQDPLGYAPGDKWYGYNNRDFQDWFHKNWKQRGDPDATREDIEDAYRAWRHEGSPKRDPK